MNRIEITQAQIGALTTNYLTKRMHFVVPKQHHRISWHKSIEIGYFEPSDYDNEDEVSLW